MPAWLVDLQNLLVHGDLVVLVTVARVEGSAPREAGTKMIVSRHATWHTIGGGHLEWKAIEIAREMLKNRAHPHARQLERFALGPSLGQCCGGAVVLAFEQLDASDLDWVATLAKRVLAGQAVMRHLPFGEAPDPVQLTAPPSNALHTVYCKLSGSIDHHHTESNTARLTEIIAPNEFSLVLFGAGHVGSALVQVLATLHCHVRWVDERDAQFPPPAVLRTLLNVTIDPNDAPDEAVDQAQPNTYFLVMTHNHTRDLALAERILRREDYAFFGMIGSRTKRKQFEHRLAARGIDPTQIARMTCPIGVEGITGKSPEIIAISTAAQLLQVVEANAQENLLH